MSNETKRSSRWRYVKPRRSLGAALLPWALACPLAAEETGLDRLKQLSLQELLDIEVTSVSRKEQRLSDTAAAITVITQDDLRRSGAIKFQDALRLVPGLEVGRVDGKEWSISARGFNDTFATKLLVMVNGRSIYTPVFSGVYWDSQNFLTEDLDRIEVIRGPGASVWGANAVNGVINIITKDARDTVGGVVSLGGGNLDPFVGEVRQGWQLGSETWLRVYGKYENHGDGTFQTGGTAQTDYDYGLGGLRLDWHPSDTGHFTAEAEGYGGSYTSGDIQPTFVPPYFDAVDINTLISGGHLLTRWSSLLSNQAEFSAQAYLDYTHREAPGYSEDRHTVDLDVGYRTPLGERHDLNVGLNYRRSEAALPVKTPLLILGPDGEVTELVSAYAQDDWKLTPDTLTLTLGTKVEHNSYTGTEVQPTARLLWSPNSIHSVWGSVSRAVRTPSVAEEAGRIASEVLPPGAVHPALPALVTLYGNPAFKSETVLAYELGYRVQPVKTLSFDLALFYNDYENLRGFQNGVPFADLAATPPRLIVPVIGVNDTQGQTYGAELSARWQATDWWQCRLSYTFQEMDLQGSEARTAGYSPRHRVMLHSLISLPHDVELDAVVRVVDGLSAAGISGYTTLDLHVAWKPRPDLELSVIGRDLAGGSHAEFPPSALFKGTGQLITEPSVFGRLKWEF